VPDILSSDELNDLLALVDEQEGSGERILFRNKTVTPYDFRRPTRLSRAQARQIQRLYESALEGLTGVLSEGLRAPIEANVLGVKALNYGSFANSLPVPTYVNIFRIEPPGFRGLLTIDVPFCLTLVDRLLGGHGHATEKPRHLTNIELAVLDWPVKLILNELQRCWHTEPEVKYTSENRRMDLSFAQVMHTSETVLRVTFALGGEIGSGEAHFCLPFTALEQVMAFDHLRDEAMGAASKQDLLVAQARQNIKKVTVSVSAELGSTTANLQEVLGLAPGQVVRLNTKAAKPIPVKVGGKVKFFGKPGLRSNTLAIRITDMIPE